ncbi:hypothetical protein J4218_02010 [Candidatus Pacearchaeota archaeon]|nr:hypothetical protein [uncultured archaeon]AQS29126.1 hypothetical protein [uncultured archaeon]MBS3078872.1 hypothetical protein [Candidatus Pacearchaeota archaeon]
MKITTIKISEDTKNRLLKLNISEKGKSFDILINELISIYERDTKRYQKDYEDWKKNHEKNKKAYEEWEKKNKEYKEKYSKEKQTWDNLLKWAKSKGFKG